MLYFILVEFGESKIGDRSDYFMIVPKNILVKLKFVKVVN